MDNENEQKPRNREREREKKRNKKICMKYFRAVVFKNKKKSVNTGARVPMESAPSAITQTFNFKRNEMKCMADFINFSIIAF